MSDALKLINSEFCVLTVLTVPTSVYYLHANTSDSRVEQTITVTLVTCCSIQLSDERNQVVCRQAVYVSLHTIRLLWGRLGLVR